MINLVTPPVINQAGLPAGTVGTAYAGATLTATAGVSPYTWSVIGTPTNFPPGLSLWIIGHSL